MIELLFLLSMVIIMAVLILVVVYINIRIKEWIIKRDEERYPVMNISRRYTGGYLSPTMSVEDSLRINSERIEENIKLLNEAVRIRNKKRAYNIKLLEEAFNSIDNKKDKL